MEATTKSRFFAALRMTAMGALLMFTVHCSLSTAFAQVAIISSSGACTNSQVPVFNSSTGRFDCAAATGGGNTTIIGNGLLSGGGVSWTPGTLTFTVATATYLIAGNQYTSVETIVTLDAASGVNPRIDAIVVDDTGIATKITGTPAATPALPSVDPTSQLFLIFVYVDTSATVPSNFTNVNIYLENTEWTCSASANFNCASTNNPFAGTKDIEATTAVKGNNVTLTKPAAATENLSDYTNINFRLRSKASWPNPKGLTLTWLNGSTQVGDAIVLKSGNFAFDSSVTSGYQLVVIPAAMFNTGQSLVTTFKITVSGGGASIGFYIDNILLQGGGNGSASPSVRFADQIVPTGAINSANTIYTLPQTPNPLSSAVCELNGLAGRQGASADYVVTVVAASPRVTYNTAPLTGDTLVCSYRY